MAGWRIFKALCTERHTSKAGQTYTGKNWQPVQSDTPQTFKQRVLILELQFEFLWSGIFQDLTSNE